MSLSFAIPVISNTRSAIVAICEMDMKLWGEPFR
jgi:hypothetical protein